MRLSYPGIHSKFSEILQSRKFSSTKDAIRLHTSLRHETRPVRVACRYLKKDIWIRPATSDLDVFREIFGDKQYGVACWDIQPKLIVDAGANIGLSSLYFARRCPEAIIVALEPEPSNVDLLRRNTQGVKNISVKEGAIWPRKTLLSVANDDAEKWAFSVNENGGGGPIRAFTIPEILAQTGFDEVDLLKLDIEGAEKELFSQGCQEWLPRIKRIVIELHDRLVPGCSRAFYSAILSRNFRQYADGQRIVIDFGAAQPLRS